MKRFPAAAVVKIILLFLILAVPLLIIRTPSLAHYLERDQLLALFSQIKNSPWGPLIFVGIYALACSVAFPGTIITLLGGVLFGVGFGTLLNLLGASLGASLAFLLSRTLGRDFASLFLKKGTLAAFDEKVAQNVFRVILALRLVPLFPFTGINFGAGLSKVAYRDYLGATIVGMIPVTFVYTYFADSLYHGASGAGRKAVIHLGLASILLLLFSFIPLFYKKYSRKTG